MAMDLILGTAGHIDHGKTALVKALTGTDTDRLPEEKRRGITIDLGFAHLDLPDVRLGIVDVPGHERFVRTMLAGASGIDLALLVVAADDSVKPQTLEHFEILKLMNLTAGVIALTKCDLADPDWIELVEDEVRELVDGSFLESAPIVRTSARTGAGLDELRDALTQAATEAARERVEGEDRRPFRLAVDRAFTIAGHGTVVTGSVGSGSARVGDVLRIEPAGIDVRVRGLQNHDQSVEQIHRGQRAALNLHGVHHAQIERGDEVCTPGHLAPSRLLTVRLDLLAAAPQPLKHRDRVRVHLGTAERLAAVSILPDVEPQSYHSDDEESPAETAAPAVQPVTPGRSALVQLFLDGEVVATWGQPLVIRRPSPAVTLGGGVVLDPNAIRIRSAEWDKIRAAVQLGDGDARRRVSAAIRLRGARAWRPEELVRLAGVADWKSHLSELLTTGEVITVESSPTQSQYVHRGTLEELGKRIQKLLARLHDQNPFARDFPPAEVASRLDRRRQVALFGAALDLLVREGAVRRSEGGIALEGRGPQLSKGEERLMNELVEKLQAAGMEPPGVDELKRLAARNREAVPKLLELAAADGLLVAVSDSLYFHRDAIDHAREALHRGMTPAGLTVSEIRELWGTTRKFAVPLCEHFDKTNVTRRNGDRRFLANEILNK